MDAYEKMAYTYFGLEQEGQAEALSAGILNLVSPEDRAELLIEFAKEAIHCEYVDNYRFYPHDMREEFYAQAEKGCCGSVNITVKCKSNNMYRVGFNYGH